MTDRMIYISNRRARMGAKVRRFLMRFRNLLGYYHLLFAVAAPFVTAVGFLLWINENLPREIAFRVPEVVDGKYFISVCIITAFLVGLTMVSAYIIQNMHDLRKREESFHYDQHGTLFNGTEPNIAFRIKTIHSALNFVIQKTDIEKVTKFAEELGQEISKDFASNIEEIMDREILGRERWKSLSFSEKIGRWSEYDSATGWGFLVARRSGKNGVNVRVSHYRGLFDGDEGEAFAAFLSGYCEGVISEIVLDHSEGVIDDYACVRLAERKRLENDMVVFDYKMTINAPKEDVKVA